MLYCVSMKYQIRLFCLASVIYLVCGAAFATAVSPNQVPQTLTESQPVTTSLVDWQPYNLGLAEARKQRKPAFIDFYTDWCHWCHELDRTTYQDPRVIDLLNRKFIPIKVDAESKMGVPIARQYPIRGYPSLWFVNASGDVIMPLNGYVQAEALVPLLYFIGDRYYEKMTYDEFMKNTWPKLRGGAPGK